jgi:glutaredoxin
MDISEEYSKLIWNFVRERKLDLDDQNWPEKDYNDFTEEYNKLWSAYQEQLSKKAAAKADEEYEEDFYTFDMIIDTEDGPEYETVDVRKMSLEELSELCTELPAYYKYYFKRVKESL